MMKCGIAALILFSKIIMTGYFTSILVRLEDSLLYLTFEPGTQNPEPLNP
jgi:hypothetical protein